MKIAILFFIPLIIFAQTPGPLQTTGQSRGGTIANQIVTQTNDFVRNIRDSLEKGIPPDGRGNPAVSPKEIRDALGPENVARLEAGLKALGGVPDTGREN